MTKNKESDELSGLAKKLFIWTFIVLLFIGIGFFWGIEVQTQNPNVITESEVTDNFEYLMYSENFPYNTLVMEKKVRELVELYDIYTMEGGTESGRVTLQALARRICFTKMTPDWYADLDLEERRNIKQILNAEDE